MTDTAVLQIALAVAMVVIIGQSVLFARETRRYMRIRNNLHQTIRDLRNELEHISRVL